MQDQYIPFIVLYIIFQMLFGPGGLDERHRLPPSPGCLPGVDTPGVPAVLAAVMLGILASNLLNVVNRVKILT